MTSAAPTACAWCEQPLDATAWRLPGRLVCPRCGAGTTDPWPTDAELAEAYAGSYRPVSGRFSGPLDAVLRRTRGRLAARIDALAPAGRVLDIGSGDGALLDALAATGRDALGLERDTAGRGDVRCAEVTELDERFAAIVLWHSLEHLREPGRALRHAAGLLEPGGVLIVAVPNVASIQALLFDVDWLALDPPRHLVHLPAATLRIGLERAGLRVIRTSHWRGGQGLFGWLHGLVARVPGSPDLYDAIRQPSARSAPMGPGKRTLALLAGVALAPVAAMATGFEVALARGGSIYFEAQRD